MTEADQHVAELDYALSMHAQTMCEIEAMKQQNQLDTANNRPISYQPNAFMDVANKNGMNHNASIIRHTF